MDMASAFFGAFLGIAGVFSLTSLALFPIIQRPYLLWGFTRTVFLSLGLLAVIPDMVDASVQSDELMNALAEAAIALGTACTGPFLATYVEPKRSIVRTQRLLWWMMPIGLFAAMASFASLYISLFAVLHDLTLLAAIALLAIGLYRMILAGSRAARFQAFAWGPLILMGIAIFAYELVVLETLPYWPIAVLAGLVVDFIVTSMGIVDGFMRVKDERDRALRDMLEAKLATTLDPLTNIANRRGLEQRFDDRDIVRPIGVALVDCDHFKRINDQFGHDVGDKVLCAVARGLDGDRLFVARLGGEEFVLLLYDRNWQEAAESARRRITQAVRAAVPELPYPITASAGLAALEENDTLGSVMKRADRALYAAKDAGRNRSLSLTEFRPGASLKSA